MLVLVACVAFLVVHDFRCVLMLTVLRVFLCFWWVCCDCLVVHRCMLLRICSLPLYAALYLIDSVVVFVSICCNCLVLLI